MTPSTEMPRLRVIRTLGGCGGTLLARLFAAIPHAVLLSETNPRSSLLYGGTLNPIAQIKKWHPTLVDSVVGFDEYEIGYPPRFGDLLERVDLACTAQGSVLVVRDFNYADFVGVPYLWPVPSDFSLDRAVEGRFRIVDFAFVREPSAQLASLRTHAAIGPVLSAERFLDGYVAFLAALNGRPVFRYEDLVSNPGESFRAMCAALDVPFDETALERHASVGAITGNMNRRDERAISAPPPSAAAMYAHDELVRFPRYDALLTALGYAPSKSAQGRGRDESPA